MNGRRVMGAALAAASLLVTLGAAQAKSPKAAPVKETPAQAEWRRLGEVIATTREEDRAECAAKRDRDYSFYLPEHDAAQALRACLRNVREGAAVGMDGVRYALEHCPPT